VRHDVDRIRKQLQLGCGLLRACATAAPHTVLGASADLLPLLLPLLRKPLVAEAPRDDPPKSDVGAVEATAALAKTLPLQGAAYHIAGALQATAVATLADPMRLAVHPAVTGSVRQLAAHVDMHGVLDMASYTLIFPILEAILLLPSATSLHSEVLTVAVAHVDAGVVGVHLLPRHLLALRHVMIAAPRNLPEAQTMLTQLLPAVHDAQTAQLAASTLVVDTPEARQSALAAADAAGVYRCTGSNGSSPTNLFLQPTALACLWVVVHDADTGIAASAKDLWAAAGIPDVVSSDFVDCITHHASVGAPSVLEAAARSAVAAARGDTELIRQLCTFATSGATGAPPQRLGGALMIREIASVLAEGEAVLDLMQFVLTAGLPDQISSIRERYVDAGSALVEAHGASLLQPLMILFDDYLENPHGLPEAVYDQVCCCLCTKYPAPLRTDNALPGSLHGVAAHVSSVCVGGGDQRRQQ
jgi:hypothetical protein